MFNRFKNGNNRKEPHQQQYEKKGNSRVLLASGSNQGQQQQQQPSKQQPQQQRPRQDDLLNDELRGSIKKMVANISKSFIVEWYTSISPTNHDFVEYCEHLIEDALTKLAELSVEKLDRYKVGQLVVTLLHDHIIHENVIEKIQSIEQQIDNYEYDICHNSVVRLFGLICTDTTKNLQDLSAKFNNNQQQQQPDDRTTSALYTLVVAMLTKSVFMPIVDQISNTKWLYAVIIRLCKEEDLEGRESKRREQLSQCGDSVQMKSNPNYNYKNNNNDINATSQNFNLHPPIIVTNVRGNRSLDLEDGQAPASNNINLDNPNCDSLKQPLDNIEIYATEEVKSSKSCYVLYCIRYDGLCSLQASSSSSSSQDVPIIDKRVLNVTNRRVYSNISNEQQAGTSTAIPTTSQNLHSDSNSTTNISSYNNNSTNPRYSRRTMTVKRRFREFVILQLRLEENPRIRPYMKNIPKPTKLKATTQSFFSGITNIKLDQSTIKLRKRFLERFLLALNSSPLIANSYEFKEFFSYNNPNLLHSTSCNISKSKSKSLNLVDSLRSALSILRSSLPDVKKSNEDLTSSPEAWQSTTNPLLNHNNRQRLSQSNAVNSRAQQMKTTITSQPKVGSNQFFATASGAGVEEDNKLLSVPNADRSRPKSSSLDRRQNYSHVSNSMQTFGLDSRGGSLRPRTSAPESSTNSSNSYGLTRTSSSSSHSTSNTEGDFSSPSSSMESVYHDATDELLDSSVKDIEDVTIRQRRRRNSHGAACDDPIQICDNIPIASKLIDVMHYSISKDHTSCSNSMINCIARRLLGKMIERHAIRLLEAAFTMDTATFCINGITSSIWDECDDDQLLDIENATLDEAVLHLTKLIESNYANYTLVPKQLLTSYVVSKQIRFYLSQLASQKRNKFVIYSFFVHLLDELELGSRQETNKNQDQGRATASGNK